MWSKSGHPLIGFAGVADNVVKGLRVCTTFSHLPSQSLTVNQPPWATWLSSVDVSRIPCLIQNARTLNRDAESVGLELKQLLIDAQKLREEVDHNTLNDPMDKGVTLACSIEYLNDMTRPTSLEIRNERRQTEASIQREMCGKEARIVKGAFQESVRQTQDRRNRCAKVFTFVAGSIQPLIRFPTTSKY